MKAGHKLLTSRLEKGTLQQLSHKPSKQFAKKSKTSCQTILFTKEESKVEILNDINVNLVTLYRVVKHHLEEFIRYLKWILVARIWRWNILWGGFWKVKRCTGRDKRKISFVDQ
jgi:hypothetical protein